MESLEYKITTQAVGESLRNFTATAKDLYVADRVYGTLVGIAHCLDGGGSFALRLRTNCFKMYDEFGKEVDLLKRLRTLAHESTLALNVYVNAGKGQRVAIRVCAMKKSAESIAEAQEKMRRKESKRQITISDDAKELNEYIIIATNLPECISSGQVLELYRLRWQVEIYFKRLKSIMNYGELPKRREESVFAWLNGKIMIALLLEKLIGKESFSPAGERCT
jgi:hypothetical protein